MAKLIFSTYQPTAKVGDFKGEVLGTLRSLATGCKLGFTNFGKADKRLQLLLSKPDGTSATVLCSKTVSELFRTKQISIGNMLTFIVEEQKSADGQIINIVRKPAVSGGTIDVDSIADENWEPSAFVGA